jgi:7,8-dihydroneopterin aldolase/epimerase/oxygenase
MKMHKDKIYIEGLRVDTVIGIWGWERQIKQRIIIDIEFSADAQRITQDNIDETVNYRDVAKKIKKFCEEKHFQLVETMAEQVVKILILDFNVEWATVRVTKPGALSDALNVGITVERNKKDYEK